MLPSLVADELRTSLTSFLGTTFALADDDVRAELERFIADDEQGVFRGPYVRLRLPFRPAAPGWRDLLDFVPRDFTPHRHQAQAWERLSSLHRTPEPTLVTTGTGSGKTESFLVPLLDHCKRHQRTRGLKALVLYPMNALANDQARRIAAMIHSHAADLGGVRVGLYTGDSPDASGMTEGGVIGTGTSCGRTRRTSCSPTTRCSTCCCFAARIRRCSKVLVSRCATYFDLKKSKQLPM